MLLFRLRRLRRVVKCEKLSDAVSDLNQHGVSSLAFEFFCNGGEKDKTVKKSA